MKVHNSKYGFYNLFVINKLHLHNRNSIFKNTCFMIKRIIQNILYGNIYPTIYYV
jgi:hypothetical protein